jgi:hypothetical protein
VQAQSNLGIPRLSSGRIDAKVAADASSGVSRFEYRLTNGSTELRVTEMSIDIRSTPDRETLSGEGLSFVNPALRAGTELALSKLGIGGFVPVGSASDPSGWVAGVQPPGDLAWGTYKDDAPGAPGDVVGGFIATSRGLPGIRRATLVPDVYDQSPDLDETDADPGAVMQAVIAARQELQTIGPVAPPKAFEAVAFADYIASLRTEAATLGWVRAGANMATVDSTLLQLRAQLQSGANGAARATASALIAAVESSSCADFVCPPSMAMTSEARALLALNTAYLQARISPDVWLETGPAHVWLGLKNSDDQGTQFDVRVALYSNETLIAEGLTRCVTGITRNAAQAKDVAIAFADSTGAPSSGATLRLEVSTRIGTNPDGTKCAGHNNAVGLRLYYDAAGRASAFGAALGGGDPVSYFLRSSGTSFTLDPSAPTATSAKQKDSGSVNFSGGNPWAVIGSWSLVVP